MRAVGKLYHYGVPEQIGTSGSTTGESGSMAVNPRGRDREVQTGFTRSAGQFGGDAQLARSTGQDAEHTDGIGDSGGRQTAGPVSPAKHGKPFFLAVGFYRPHTPYVAPKKLL